jgi:hypothetical protein
VQVAEVEVFAFLMHRFLAVDHPELLGIIFQSGICIEGTTSVLKAVECPEDVIQRQVGQLATSAYSGTSAWLRQIRSCPAS